MLRRVSRRQVAATIDNPNDLYEDTTSSTLVAVRHIKNSYLVVVYAPSEEERRVVTLYNASDVDRLIRRKLERGIWRKTG